MNEGLIVASVVTKSCLKEFLLTKYSCELFNDCRWYVSCDQYCVHKLNKYDNITLLEFDIDDTISDHNSATPEDQEAFLSIILNKFKALKKALKENEYCLFLDSDMLFVNKVDTNIIELIKEGRVDFVASPHYTSDPLVEHKHGVYNVGMFAVNDDSKLDEWINLTKNHKKLNLYYEQKPFELILKNFLFLTLPINYNIGWWRFNNELTQSRLKFINEKDGHICFGRLPAVNFHFHVFKEPGGYNPGGFLVEKIFNLMKGSDNEKYHKILEYYEHLSETPLQAV
jgi:hypothetical protein